MRLEEVAAVIRPRRPWEAVDLGFAMAREWWRPLLAGWLGSVVPLWLLLLILVLGGLPGLWCLLALWWLRPLYSLAPLHVLSRSLFGAPPGWRETASHAFRESLRLAPRLLLWRRLDPQRSLLLPVYTLEGSRGAELRARVRLFSREMPEASWLTVGSAALEGSLVLALFGLAALLLPTGTVDWTPALEGFFDGDPPAWFARTALTFWLLAVTVVEPCYTAAGFALYLNRRTLLEGWDVEVALRRLAGRLRRGGARARIRRSARAALLLVALAAGSAAAAQPPQRPVPRAPAEVAREVLAHPDFGSTRRERVWRLRGQSEVPRGGQVERLSLASRLAGGGVEVLLLAALLGVVLWALVRLVQRGRSPLDASGVPSATDDEEGPRRFALGAARGELPVDTVTAALAELEAGRPAAALSLLYRGALAALAARRRLVVPASWTEEQCLARLPADLPPRTAQYLREVTAAWQAAAYAHRLPGAEQVRQLCSRWRGDLAGLGGAA